MQFRYVQGIPSAPPRPIKCVRPFEMQKYEVLFQPDLLGAWDADPRPLIKLDVQDLATLFWDVTDDYLDWLDDVSHVLVDPRSPRQDRLTDPVHPPPPVDTLVRSQLVYGEMCRFLLEPESRPTDFVALVERWIH